MAAQRGTSGSKNQARGGKAVDEPPVPKEDHTVFFDTVFASELACIEARRDYLKSQAPSYSASHLPETPPVDKTKPVDNIVGLALSGGGIRSAGFCLGVLQALDAALSSSTSATASDGEEKTRTPTLLERVDYLSTVSGGGYIGCSLVAALSKRAGKFPFASDLTGNDEAAAIKHIRDHSNYLFPRGLRDLFPNLAIYLRGLFANFIIVLPLILVAALFTIYCSPTDGDLVRPKFYTDLSALLYSYTSFHLPLFSGGFAFTKLVLSILVVLLFIWGLFSIVDKITPTSAWRFLRALVSSALTWAVTKAAPVLTRIRKRRADLWRWLSQKQKANPRLSWVIGLLRWINPNRRAKRRPEDERLSEADSRWAKLGGFVLIAVAVCLFCEAQPFVLTWLFAKAAATPDGGHVTTLQKAPAITFYSSAGAAALTLIASTIGLLADKLQKAIKLFSQDTGFLARTVRGSSKLVILAASAALPLTLWILYVLLSFWGIASPLFGARKYAAPDWLLLTASSFWSKFPDFIKSLPFGDVVLNWLRDFMASSPQGLMLSLMISKIGSFISSVSGATSIVGALYFSVGLFVLLLATLPTLNANSLHRLYRDRLSHAFIFFETTPSLQDSLKAMILRAPVISQVVSLFVKPFSARKANAGDEEAPRDGTEILPLDQLKLTELQARYGPYLLVNAALNIQGSKYANQRGRNADFFVFSRNYTGSEGTKYLSSHQMQAVASDLNLATVMAVSGAAASSNMGSNTIRPLTPTLTILNIRLGYWLRNPRAAVGRFVIGTVAWLSKAANIYVFKEMLGLLNERSSNIYLTDGGHIDNTGIYQLLKRRCKLIVAVDAEADAQMNFESFVKMQRYARIDLGVRIELPWQEIRTVSLDTQKKIADKDVAVPSYSRNGPHCAVGVIEYSKSEFGYLLYIKSSMSGDENDYITDYKRRFPAFPHETTGDQLFSEEQFEVYRSLGFHAAHNAFTNEDEIVCLARKSRTVQRLKWNSTHHPMPDIKKILHL